MRTSPSFESQNSFEDVDSTTLENDEDLQMDWGVVSTTESDVVSGLRSNGTTIAREYIGQGILIVDGVNSATSRNERSSNLSLPGSDSIPSDLDSLSGIHAMDNPTVWMVKKRIIYLVGSVIVLAFSVVTGLLIQQHARYQSVVQELGEKIHQLEKEKEELSSPAWVGDGELDDSSTFFTLLDSCWVKARMNLKFGDCSQNSFGLCGEFVSHATDLLQTWFAENGVDTHDQDQNDGDDVNLYEEMFTAISKYPDVIGKAMVSASKAVSDMMRTLNLAGDDDDIGQASEDLIWASEAFSEAAQSAQGAVVYNFNEFVKDPIKYFTGALEEASQPPTATEVSMNGLINSAKSLSEASVEWVNTVAKSSEAFSHKMIQLFNIPSSSSSSSSPSESKGDEL